MHVPCRNVIIPVFLLLNASLALGQCSKFELLKPEGLRKGQSFDPVKTVEPHVASNIGVVPAV
jgi:hypothetical protein